MANEIASTNRPPKSREWEVVFYDDNEAHIEELKTLIKEKNVVGAYHDRDLKEDGTPKKAHYHIYIKFENTSTLGSVEKLIPNHETNLIKAIKSFRGACRYLLHLDNPEKAQYDETSLVGNVSLAKRYLQSDDVECEAVRKILTFIDTSDDVLFDKDVLFWCCSENLYSVYRRGAYLFSRVIEQHNKDVHNRWIKDLSEGAEDWKFKPAIPVDTK